MCGFPGPSSMHRAISGAWLVGGNREPVPMTAGGRGRGGTHTVIKSAWGEVSCVSGLLLFNLGKCITGSQCIFSDMVGGFL